jgi:predicted enzyme related to lactoylglutathione lyase
MPVANSTSIKGIDIVTYLVQDTERAKAFYRDTLGLSVSADYGPQGAEFELRDGATFGIWKMTDGSYRPSGGIMFAVDDLKSAVAEFKTRGVSFDDDGAIDESPVCFMAFATDPEGNTFILHQRKQG